MLSFSHVMIVAGGIGLTVLTVFGFDGAVSAETIVHAFAGGDDGLGPGAGLISDQVGNLYGTTAGGGGGCQGLGCGTVFKLSPNGTETILYSFAGGSDGQNPESGLVLDSAGDLYGTTASGGSADAGTVFKLAPDGTETVLYAFQNESDGAAPQGNVVIDQDGNLYGTTAYGGNTPGCGGLGCGTVFRVSPDGKETILYTFQGGSDGSTPLGVILDQSGNLYGTGLGGGTGCACGVVFKLAPDGSETVLHAFQGGADGMEPVGALIADGSGNFYGATEFGGGGGSCCGTIFRVLADGTETILYAFRGGNDAESPFTGLVMDAKRNLYGTKYFGGGTKCGKTGHIGCGTVFKLKPDGKETVLLSFQGKRGAYPTAPLLLKSNFLFGTTVGGGQFDDGVVFSLKK